MHRTLLARFGSAILSVLVGLVATVRDVQAQLELIPFVAYRVGGESGNVSIKDNEAFGGMLRFGLARGKGIEFGYSHQDSKVEAPLEDFNLKTDQWWIGGGQELVSKGKFIPHANGFLGLTSYSSSDGDIEGSERFMIGFGLGGTTRFGQSQRVGLRIDFRGYFTFLDSGAGMFCGTGSGCSLTFGGSGIFQGDIALGLSIMLGQPRP